MSHEATFLPTFVEEKNWSLTYLNYYYRTYPNLIQMQCLSNLSSKYGRPKAGLGIFFFFFLPFTVQFLQRRLQLLSLCCLAWTPQFMQYGSSFTIPLKYKLLLREKNDLLIVKPKGHFSSYLMSPCLHFSLPLVSRSLILLISLVQSEILLWVH